MQKPAHHSVRFNHFPHHFRTQLKCRRSSVNRSNNIIEQRCVLLKQTHLTNKEQAQMLTSGLPASWRPLLTSCQVQTPNDWIGIELELEHDFKAAESKKFNKPQKPFFKKKSPVNMAVGTSQQTQQKPKPSYPCRFCKALNIEVWHWHSDCPNRSNSSKKPNRSPTDTNLVTTQQDSSADVMPSNALSGPQQNCGTHQC